ELQLNRLRTGPDGDDELELVAVEFSGGELSLSLGAAERAGEIVAALRQLQRSRELRVTRVDFELPGAGEVLRRGWNTGRDGVRTFVVFELEAVDEHEADFAPLIIKGPVQDCDMRQFAGRETPQTAFERQQPRGIARQGGQRGLPREPR